MLLVNKWVRQNDSGYRLFGDFEQKTTKLIKKQESKKMKTIEKAKLIKNGKSMLAITSFSVIDLSEIKYIGPLFSTSDDTEPICWVMEFKGYHSSYITKEVYEKLLAELQGIEVAGLSKGVK